MRLRQSRFVWVAAAIVSVCGCGVCGCNVVRYIAHVFAPEAAQKTVQPEYAHLRGHSVAVVVFADAKTQYEQPHVELNLGAVVGTELFEKVKDMTIVPASQVANFQRNHRQWETLDRTELGRRLGADYVLHISLEEFSTHEPGSLVLLRGRITAQVTLHKTSQKHSDGAVWRSGTMRVLFPPSGPTGEPAATEENVRYETSRIFAAKLVSKFYKHKEPK